MPNYNELYHHGILGMKWGVRRFQNKDGTRTEAGKKRYSGFGTAIKAKYKKFKQTSNLKKARAAKAIKDAQQKELEKKKQKWAQDPILLSQHISDFTTDELREYRTRLQLKGEIANLSQDKIKRGAAYVSTMASIMRDSYSVYDNASKLLSGIKDSQKETKSGQEGMEFLLKNGPDALTKLTDKEAANVSEYVNKLKNIKEYTGSDDRATRDNLEKFLKGDAKLSDFSDKKVKDMFVRTGWEKTLNDKKTAYDDANKKKAEDDRNDMIKKAVNNAEKEFESTGRANNNYEERRGAIGIRGQKLETRPKKMSTDELNNFIRKANDKAAKEFESTGRANNDYSKNPPVREETAFTTKAQEKVNNAQRKYDSLSLERERLNDLYLGTKDWKKSMKYFNDWVDSGWALEDAKKELEDAKLERDKKRKH